MTYLLIQGLSSLIPWYPIIILFSGESCPVDLYLTDYAIFEPKLW